MKVISSWRIRNERLPIINITRLYKADNKEDEETHTTQQKLKSQYCIFIKFLWPFKP
jgi:hypothetical protein